MLYNVMDVQSAAMLLRIDGIVSGMASKRN